MYSSSWVGNMMDSNTTVTLWRIRNSGAYLQAHYDGPYHRGVAQLTLDDAGRIHVTLDPYSWVRATSKENLCIQQSLQNFMEWLGSYLILELFCFCFLILFFPGLFKQQGKNMSNFEFTVGLFALVFLILVFFFPDLIEEIIWGGSWCLLPGKGRSKSHDP